MKKITDEILMAYIDGELDDQKASKIREAIESDSETFRRAEILSASDSALKGAYDSLLQEPVPNRLIETVMGFNADNPFKIFLKSVISFFHMPPGWRFTGAAVVSLALLVAIILVSTQPSRQESSLYSLIINTGGFSHGLETTISGKTFKTADNKIKVTPVFTFVDKSHRYCRQYEMISAGDYENSLSRGIACRDNSGHWETTALVFQSPSDTSSTDTNAGYIKAGGNDLIDTITSTLMAKPPMTLKREKKLINNSWPKTPDR